MTVFLRLLEAAPDEKGAALSGAAKRWRAGEDTREIFQIDPSSFGQVPGSPFAYWVSERVRSLFTELPGMEADGRRVERGAFTSDDFRFLRLEWEIDGATIAGSLDQTFMKGSWVRCAKGGAYSPYYADLHLLIRWAFDAREIGALVVEKYPYLNGDENWVLHRECSYFQPGLTWPLRTTSAFAPRILPAGAVFSNKGPTLFTEGGSERMLALLALMLSTPFAALVELQLAAAAAAARSYEIGLIKGTPISEPTGEQARRLASLAANAWRLARLSDKSRLPSHAFHLPALLQVEGESLARRWESWSNQMAQTKVELRRNGVAVDDIAFNLYGIDGEDRRQMEEGFEGLGSQENGAAAGGDDEEAEEEEAEGADPIALTEALLEWSLGVVLGRFDVRLATCESAPPPDPDPFGPLPVCSPGMLQGKSGLPTHEAPAGYPLALVPDGILVDDPGHPWDVVARIEAVFDLVAGDRAHAWIQELEEILGRDLRDWLRRYGFERHLKRYSRSRRKAPLLWHLAPKSREYGIWLYSPAATRDTFYRIQNDYVEPKLKATERRLLELRQHAGASPTGQQRKDITAQAYLVEELRAFRDEVARIAPLWKPCRDDGIVLNCAALSGLFDHHRAWQKECAKKWDELASGKYDWAGWAMHLWPERVVTVCASDRSIAIAHGLEEALWEEGDNGKWVPRADAQQQISKLIPERQSAAVQAAIEAYVRAS